jgi:hypothetical protein
MSCCECGRKVLACARPDLGRFRRTYVQHSDRLPGGSALLRHLEGCGREGAGSLLRREVRGGKWSQSCGQTTSEARAQQGGSSEGRSHRER